MGKFCRVSAWKSLMCAMEMSNNDEAFEMTPMETVSMDCDCHSPRHMVRFNFDPNSGDLYLDFQLSRWPGLFRRCWYGLKYVLNLAEPESHWDCVILSDSIDELLELIQRAKEAQCKRVV